MTKYEVLNQLNQKQIERKEAYKMLYQTPKERKPRRAHFVKIKIRIPESRGVTILLKVLFALPIHIGLVKLFLPKRKLSEPISEEFDISPLDLIDLIAIKGVKVDIQTKTNERIYIKTI